MPRSRPHPPILGSRGLTIKEVASIRRRLDKLWDSANKVEDSVVRYAGDSGFVEWRSLSPHFQEMHDRLFGVHQLLSNLVLCPKI